jgi:hypothetical protein
MRLQLLAQEMKAHREMDADVSSVIHISPRANTLLRNRVTSPYLAEHYPGRGIYDIWLDQVGPDSFTPVAVEELLEIIGKQVEHANPSWAQNLKLRYSWNQAKELA